MDERVRLCEGLVRDIEALGRGWRDWRQGEQRQHRAVELLCGVIDPREGPEISVTRDEFNVAGEIMICLHPGCGGFVRGPLYRGGYIIWATRCACPNCGQRYVIRDF
jgi:hypothetical protein